MGILLGFEIPTGFRVEVPAEGHFAVFGQTQLSGKTTAIEALVYRSSFKAVAFITKRGEGSFLTARIIPPFFSEPTNDPEQPLWRWVTSILEASQKRRMRFEESWIIRACEEPKHAKTLADVHGNINSLLEGERETRPGRGGKKKHTWARKPVSGINAGVYTSLKAYFDIVMPQLARLPYTTKLKLEPGLSVMDLRDYSIEMQALVIRAVMEHVYLHERNVRVIVPEAWQFIPEHRNTPVKMACEQLIRMGAADKNFLWADSQDMAACDKIILRQMSVLLCGVQGELNEIDRTIDSLFGGHGMTARDVGSLKIGQFFVRMPGGEVKKVYVQPAWMDSEPHAQAIARGEESINSARPMEKAFEKTREAEDDEMWKQKYETLEAQHTKLQAEHKLLIAAHDSMAERLLILESAEPPTRISAANGKAAAVVGQERPQARSNADTEFTPAAASSGNGHLTAVSPDGGTRQSLNEIYCYVMDRAAKEDRLMEVLQNRPELHVKVTRQRIEADGSTLRGALALLISKKFFDSPVNGNSAFNELKRQGRSVAKPNVYRELDKLAELGFVTKEETGYQAVAGMKVHIEEA